MKCVALPLLLRFNLDPENGITREIWFEMLDVLTVDSRLSKAVSFQI